MVANETLEDTLLATADGKFGPLALQANAAPADPAPPAPPAPYSCGRRRPAIIGCAAVAVLMAALAIVATFDACLNDGYMPGEKDTKSAHKLGQLQPSMAVLPQECMAQLAPFGLT
jgi:hypothetical protein